MPLLVLSADRPWGPQVPSMIAAGILPADIPPDFGYVTDNAQKQAQQLRFETCQDHLTHFLTREHLTFEQRFGKRQETDKLREADKEKMKTSTSGGVPRSLPS